jgi:hypothetical protein
MVLIDLIGMLVVAALIGAGVYWVLSNVTLKRQAERYSYTVDKDGNENVKDHTDAKA